MTSEGISRVLNLFLNDIDKLTYTVNNTQKEVILNNYKIEGTIVSLYFKIPRDQIGTFDNFKLIGKNGTTYERKVLNFQKNNDEVIIELPFSFIKEV